MRNLTDVSLMALLVSAVVAVSMAAGPRSPADSPPVMRGDVWLFPSQTFPLAATVVGGEVWVFLAYGDVAVLPRDGGPPARSLPAGVWGFPIYDAARSRVYLSGSPDGEVRVVDAATREHVGTLTLPTVGAGITIVGGLAYVNCLETPVLYVADLATLRVVDQVALSQPGFESVAVGNKLYVATGHEPGPENNWAMTGAAVDIVDLQALRLEKTISVPGADLRAVAWDGGRYVYAASSVAGELVRIDVETDTLDERLRLAVGRVYDIVVDPVRRIALLACDGMREEISVVSLETLQEVIRFEGGAGIMGVDRDATGALRNIWVPNLNGSYVLRLDGSQVVTSSGWRRPDRPAYGPAHD